MAQFLTERFPSQIHRPGGEGHHKHGLLQLPGLRREHGNVCGGRRHRHPGVRGGRGQHATGDG